MADRKAELEKKRKKLDELRKARELKKAVAKDTEVVWTIAMFTLRVPCILVCLMVCIKLYCPMEPVT